jgi:hypothetical protein
MYLLKYLAEDLCCARICLVLVARRDITNTPQQAEPDPSHASNLHIVPPIQSNRDVTGLSDVVPPPGREIQSLTGLKRYVNRMRLWW